MVLKWIKILKILVFIAAITKGLSFIHRLPSVELKHNSNSYRLHGEPDSSLQQDNQILDEISLELTSSDVSYMSFVTRSPEEKAVDLGDTDFSNFATIFRDSAPYIAMHRGSTMVIHLPGSTFQNRALFEGIIDDLSILHLLGVRLILVVGVRDQLEERVKKSGSTSRYYKGMRVTDEAVMRILKEEYGIARFEMESALARGFRGTTNHNGVNVVSGNFFYTAKPLGVRDGVDFRLTGEVRKVEVENLKKRLEAGDLVMLTALGYTKSGEVYNVPSESLAAECAAKMGAAKVIYLTHGQQLLDTRNFKPVQSLRLNQAVALLDQWGIGKSLYNYMDDANGDTSTTTTTEETSTGLDKALMDVNSKASFILLMARCVYALNGGVKRAHLINLKNGALLKELYTRDGSGILISRDMYEGMRKARESDIHSVQEIIRPLEEEGILAPRSKEELMLDIPNIFLLTRDEKTVACGMLKKFGDSHAEIACLAVHPMYRRGGRGETVLAYLERRALLMGVTTIFVLSTRTMQWFEERGFQHSDPSLLPPTRYYNPARNSKVYIKHLQSQRDVDAEELMWHNE